MDDYELFRLTGQLNDSLEKNIEALLKKDDNNLSINDILKIYSIYLIIKKQKSLDDKILKLWKDRFFKYFALLPYAEISNYFKRLDSEFTDKFWRIIELQGKYKEIPHKEFIKCEKVKQYNLGDILLNKRLAQYFEHEILDYIKERPIWISRILDKYIDPKNYNADWKIPNGIDNVETLNELVDKYLEYDKANPDYLMLIANAFDTGNFNIDDELKYRAKLKADSINDEFFNSGNTSQNSGMIETTVSLDPNVPLYDINTTDTGEKLRIDYKFSSSWLSKYLDYPTILNNFIYVFGITDLHYRATYLSNPFYDSWAERLFGFSVPSYYHNNMYFRHTLMRVIGSITLYRHFLEENDINLEDVIKWFFEKYLLEEFDVDKFRFNIPKSDASFLEKSRQILPEIDGLLKQYSYYVKHKDIDWKYLNTQAKPTVINNVPSMIQNKYAYLTPEIGKEISECLFNDQKLITFHNEKYKNFGAYIEHNSISTETIKDIDKPDINFLIKHNILMLKDDKLVLNRKYYWIIKDIYIYHEFEPYYYDHDVRETVKKMYKAHIIRFGSTLLSQDEINFFNYVMNRHSYANSLEIRNKMLHQHVDESDSENEETYSYIILILIQIVIRINEEFRYVDEHKSVQYKWY